MGKAKNLIGKIFGRLTVREKSNKRSKSGNIYWKCICSCGNRNLILVVGSSLINGNTKSCGCLPREIARTNGKKTKKYNQYDLSKEYGIGYTSKKEIFYFDLDDYEKINKYCWTISNNGYVVSKEIDSRNLIYLHKKIIDKTYDENKNIDHINRNKLDNRKENLRIISAQQNSINRTITDKNTSGFIGVTWDKQNKKWISQIKTNNKNKKLGRFESIEDALIARLKAEKELWGDQIAPQRHLFDEYGV